MVIPAASLLGLMVALSEIGLAVFKRANTSRTRSADRGSLSLLWLVIGASVWLAYALPSSVPSLAFARPDILQPLGIALLLTGLALRWYAIVFLGRFFTVNVALAADHKLVDGGPYRYVRHPSYLGAMMAFVGLGLCLGNWASLAVISVPTFLAFLRRMSVEESALAAGLGEPYRGYMRRTKRLIPGVY